MGHLGDALRKTGEGMGEPFGPGLTLTGTSNEGKFWWLGDLALLSPLHSVL